MADIYVDPSAGTNGSGSYASPRTLWPTSIGAGDRILLKRGTRLVTASQLSFGGGSNNLVTWYGDATAPRPIITSTAPNFGQINVAVAGVTTFDGIHFDQCLGGAVNGGVVVASPVAGGRVASLAFRNCRFSGTSYNAIKLNGTDTATAAASFLCEHSEFDDIGEDCVFGGALDFVFAYNRCTNLSSRTLTGDGVGFINADPVRVWVHHNYIDHSRTDCKQCVIVDTVTDGAGTVIIEDNHLIGYGSPGNPPVRHSTIISQGTTKIRRNRIETWGIAGAVNTAADEISSNLILAHGFAEIGPPLAMFAGGEITGNTIVATRDFPANAPAIAVAASVGAAAKIRSNAIIGFPRGIRADGAVNPTCWRNAFWRCAQPMVGQSGAFTGLGDVLSDPRLNSDYRPLVGSPLISAGHNAVRRDFSNRQGRKFIGAFCSASLRS